MVIKEIDKAEIEHIIEEGKVDAIEFLSKVIFRSNSVSRREIMRRDIKINKQNIKLNSKIELEKENIIRDRNSFVKVVIKDE